MRICLLVPQHYRDVLKLLQTVLNHTRVTEEDYSALLRVVQDLQVGKPVRYMLRQCLVLSDVGSAGPAGW